MNRIFALCAAIGFSSLVAAQPYPTKPVRMINPFPAGGPVDVAGRPVLEKLRAELGQPFVMENRPGGATIVASEAVAKAPADGYTLLFTAAQFPINPSIFKKLPFDTVKDFQPVSLVAQGPFVMVVHPSVPASNLAELIALAKAQPGKLNYASAGSGSLFHMAGELFKMLAAVNIVHVPYKGGAPATTSVLAGETQIMFGSPAGATAPDGGSSSPDNYTFDVTRSVATQGTATYDDDVTTFTYTLVAGTGDGLPRRMRRCRRRPSPARRAPPPTFISGCARSTAPSPPRCASSRARRGGCAAISGRPTASRPTMPICSSPRSRRTSPPAIRSSPPSPSTRARRRSRRACSPQARRRRRSSACAARPASARSMTEPC